MPKILFCVPIEMHQEVEYVRKHYSINISNVLRGFLENYLQQVNTERDKK